MRKDYTKRFQSAPWALDEPFWVNLFGCGGIGSWSAVMLARTGATISLVDMDAVEEVNMGGQLFRIEDIGQSKTTALGRICYSFGAKHVYDRNGEVNPEFFQSSAVSFDVPIWISAFDNMLARKLLFSKWKELAVANDISKKSDIEGVPGKKGLLTPVFIDGRLTAETFQVYAVTHPDQFERFEKTMFDDEEVEDLPCSFKATSHCAAMIGAVITGTVTNHITNCMEGKVIREVPFETEFSMPLLMLNVIR